MIKIRQNPTPIFEDGIWYFQIFGPDTTDGTVRLVSVESVDVPDVWLANNQMAAQALIDASQITSVFTVLQEARSFLDDNPAAVQLVGLGPEDLEAAIENRNANQETLLLKTLAFAIRLFYAERSEM